MDSDSLLLLPPQPDHVAAMAHQQVGIGSMNNDRASFHGGIDHKLLRALTLTRIHRREIAAREGHAIIEADIGKAAVVIHGNRNHPGCLAAGGIVIAVVVTTILLD